MSRVGNLIQAALNNFQGQSIDGPEDVAQIADTIVEKLSEGRAEEKKRVDILLNMCYDRRFHVPREISIFLLEKLSELH